MNNIRPFRFWCQKVLPLVYDDSLSYYELLCKVVNKLNEIVNNENNLNKDFKELYEYVTNYINSLDIESDVKNVLNEWLNDGTISGI